MSQMNKDSLAVALLSAGLATFFAGGATQAIGLGFVGVALSVLGACILLRRWIPAWASIGAILTASLLLMVGASRTIVLGFRGERFFDIATAGVGMEIFFLIWFALLGGALAFRTRGWGRVCAVLAIIAAAGMVGLLSLDASYFVFEADVPPPVFLLLGGALAWLGLDSRRRRNGVESRQQHPVR